MAKGDVQYSRRSGGGSSFSYGYDDEGRGGSKSYYESFEKYFTSVDNPEEWLFNDTRQICNDGYGRETIYNHVSNMTYRYNIHDWAWRKFEDDERNDGRVRRLIVKKLGVQVWERFQKYAKELYDAFEEEVRQHNAARSEEWENEMKAHEAIRIARETEEKQLIMKDVDLITGAVQSDFHTSFTYQEQYGTEDGDWLDDPVSSYATGYGFGVESKQAHGIKLQITVSLDCSNSMIYNKVNDVAAIAFRNIYMALEEMQKEFPTDLFIAAFEFCQDGYESNERGKVATVLGHNDWGKIERRDYSKGVDLTYHLGAVEAYRNDSYTRSHFTGEDTWFFPLFELIERWERDCSEPGALRLDMIITDAVIEHATDVRRSDIIQERGDGALQTVLLNFLPEDEWVNSDLPLRCVQYPVNAVNIDGMLRNIINEFVSVYM